MRIKSLIQMALDVQATDLHIESAMPPSFRVHGHLRRGTQVLSRSAVDQVVRELLTRDQLNQFKELGSVDITKVFGKLNTRIHFMSTDRGPALAVRLLQTSTPTLKTSNLHPLLGQLVQHDHGLILLTGPTGSGKSTTLSSMLEEINLTASKNIVTLESPIEYRLQSKKSLIRQREVGVHTVSFEHGLRDSLREDPDVIVVGEMREPETMRLALTAAETGHLVLATLHAANAADAVYRMMMSFPPESQSSVLAQLADSLVAIVSQKMSYRSEEKLLVPILEVLVGSYAAKHTIRKGEGGKLISIIQMGGPDGHWTFERYQGWVDSLTEFHRPEPASEVDLGDDSETSESRSSTLGDAGNSYDGDAMLSGSDVGDSDSIPMSDEREVVTHSKPSPYDVSRSKSGQKRRVQSPGQIAASALASGRSTVDEAATSDSAASSGRARSGKKIASMKIHKDGRIEIPELDLDLNEMARSIVGSGGDVE